MMRFLIQAGANIHYESRDGSNIIAQAVLISALLDASRAAELLDILPAFDYINMPVLRKAILGFLDLDIVKLLQNPKYLSEINTLDSGQGLAPLHYAALKGDTRAI